jgi:hypothetical protein
MDGNINEKKSLTNRNGSKMVFLVWDRQSIRALGIAKHFGANLYLLYTSRIKHPVLFVRSFRILMKDRPAIVFCQSPPITCAIIPLLYKYLFARKSKPKIIIDIHTGAITKPWSRTVSRLIMRLATYNIVTNKELQDYLSQRYHIKSLVLEDPIPDFSDILSTTNKVENKPRQEDTFNIAVISSFAYDEPLQVVFDTASQLPDIHFYITGDKTKMDRKFLDRKLNNVILTGLLEYHLYLDLLQKVDAIIDLTTDDKTMLSGAYEAVALERPLIISNWMPLRRYFNKGTIYVKNSAKDIKEGIMIARTEKEELSRQMHQLKAEKIKEWNEKISKICYIFT